MIALPVLALSFAAVSYDMFRLTAGEQATRALGEAMAGRPVDAGVARALGAFGERVDEPRRQLHGLLRDEPEPVGGLRGCLPDPEGLSRPVVEIREPESRPVGRGVVGGPLSRGRGVHVAAAELPDREEGEVDDEENPTVLTFHLRPDVYWHDGEKLDADDVAFTYRVVTDTLSATFE